MFTVQDHETPGPYIHQDLGLERDGMLKCWLLPKGVPEEPRVRRVAKQVKDHDLLYGLFEGEIPEERYGAGTIRIWDLGTYETKVWSDTKVE